MILEANPPAFKGIDGEDETFRRGIEKLQLVQGKEVWSQFPQDLINLDTTMQGVPQDLINSDTTMQAKIEDKKDLLQIRYSDTF